MTVKLAINNIKNTAFLFSRYKLYIDIEMYIDLGLRPRLYLYNIRKLCLNNFYNDL